MSSYARANVRITNEKNKRKIPMRASRGLKWENKMYKLKRSISGGQVYHHIVRNKIVEHMTAIESALLPHINSSLNNYLARSRMKKENVWATDIEILTASSRLQTDIYVYTEVGSSDKW